MSVVKLTAKDRKGMQTMSKNDVLTDEQKAKLEAERFEEYAQDSYERIVRKIAGYREELAEQLRKAAELAEKPEGDPLWELDRRANFELAARIRVYSRLLAMKSEGATYTAWINEAKQSAIKQIMLEVSESQSTSMLANYVKALELYTYKQFAEGWTY